MKQWAILYLGTLRIVQVGTRDEIKGLIHDARQKIQPFVVLRYRMRAGGLCWSIQEVHYLLKPFFNN